jgi:ADP-L-glycero-D-manno-heptose 6-epimerase
MRVIVTGGAGFIGSCMVQKLNSEGFRDILVVDHLETSLKWKNLVGKQIQDYLEKDRFIRLVGEDKLKDRFDLVIHFGACTSTNETNASYLMENNYLYSKTLAKWALKHKARFLYASSAATYGSGEFGYQDDDEVSLKLKPLNLYGYSKQLFDLWVIKNKLASEITGFKFFNVFGPNEYHKGNMQSIIAKVFEGVADGEPLRLFKSYRKEYPDGEQKRDFIYVKDALEVVSYFINHPDKKGIFNLGTGQARTWNDIANSLFSALGLKPKIEYIEMPEDLRDKYQYFTEADLTKLRKAGCEHEFLSLEQAVKDYAGYLKNHSYL